MAETKKAIPRKLKARDLCFDLDTHLRVSRCAFCNEKYDNQGIAIELLTTRRIYGGCLCGNCLTPDPKRLAQIARERAPVLRQTRPRRGDDSDGNTKWADDMLAFAEVLEQLDDFSAVDGGLMALKIAEGYRETEAANRKRKAA